MFANKISIKSLIILFSIYRSVVCVHLSVVAVVALSIPFRSCMALTALCIRNIIV